MSGLKIISLIVAVLYLTTPVVQSQTVPATYYTTINGKKEKELKTALHQILKNHTVYDYNSLWTFFRSTDARPENSSIVWDMYSSKTYYFSNTWGMNREHSFPKSWWGGDVNAAYTDLNHLYPSDEDANLAKNNYPLGTVGSATFNNGITKVGTANTPGYSGIAFEPADEYKGDFARTYFYMVTCYEDYFSKWKYDMLDNNTYPVFRPWAVSLLLKWSRQDPVSSKERNRNEEVYRIQNNRNPYIDYPQLVEYIWGDSTQRTFQVPSLPPVTNQTPVLVNPTNETTLNFGEVVTGQSKTLKLFVKGIALKSNLSALVYDGNSTYFQTIRSIPYTDANSSTGYQLNVKYSPAAIGKHQSSIILYDGGITGSIYVRMSGECIEIPKLNAPVALDADQVQGSSFLAHWSSVPGAGSYTLYLYTYNNGINTPLKTVENVEETSLSIDGLSPLQSYTYTVKAEKLGYYSPLSNEIRVNTTTASVVQNAEAAYQICVRDNKLMISNPTNQTVSLAIYLTDGRVVKEAFDINQSTTIPLQKGVYILSVNRIRQKIIVP